MKADGFLAPLFGNPYRTHPHDSPRRPDTAMKHNAKKALGCEDCGGACHVSNIACGYCGGKPAKFASGAELTRYAELVKAQKRGEIRNLRRQVKYPLSIEGRPIKIRSDRYKNGRQCNYTPDFVYEEWFAYDQATKASHEWVMIVEESKGIFTEASRLRIAVFEAQYQVTVRFTGTQKMIRRRKAA